MIKKTHNNAVKRRIMFYHFFLEIIGINNNKLLGPKRQKFVNKI